MASPKVVVCSNLLVENKWKIAFVESATAGKMNYEFSTVPNSGKILMGGLVCYDRCMKEEVLEIPLGLMETFSAESAEVTQAMAVNFSNLKETEVCVAITGLTAPGGSETEEKPVGTMFVHIILPYKHIAKRFLFEGSAEEIVNQTIDATAEEILNELI